MKISASLFPLSLELPRRNKRTIIEQWVSVMAAATFSSRRKNSLPPFSFPALALLGLRLRRQLSNLHVDSITAVLIIIVLLLRSLVAVCDPSRDPSPGPLGHPVHGHQEDGGEDQEGAKPLVPNGDIAAGTENDLQYRILEIAKQF